MTKRFFEVKNKSTAIKVLIEQDYVTRRLLKHSEFVHNIYIKLKTTH